MAAVFIPGLDGPRREATDDRWMADAACVGQTDLFFPVYAERPQARAKREQDASALCAACPVRVTCRQYGREQHEYGIWGGENEEERVLAGYSLIAPIGTRSIKRAKAAMAMPLAELTGPTDADLAATTLVEHAGWGESA
jgi:WhiB family transcriptional regulator, redox-sensing transcriptional regulator